MKPILKWSGGKRNEIKSFKRFFPEKFDRYIEPFVGGGAVYFDLNFDGKNVINDNHPDLMNFYQTMKDGKSKQIHDLVSSWGTTESDYYFYRGVGKTCNEMNPCFQPKNEIEEAARFFYLRKTCFRGMLRYNSKGEFNVPWGRYKKVNFDELLNDNYTKLLKETDILNGDFRKVFKKYNSPNNFVFLDPPYDSEFSDYGYDNFNQKSHIELAEIFNSTKNKCLLVISETPFIQDLYKNNIQRKYHKNYAFKIYGGRIGKEINKNHLVITNYEI